MALNYWVAYAKGISLLQMALDNPKVNFEEGSYTISRHKSNLLAQEQNFEDTVGQESITLAEGIISAPADTHPVIWRVASGTYIQDHTDPYENWVVPDVEAPTSAWVMKRYPIITPDQFDPTGSYPVMMEPTDKTGHILCISGSQYGLDTGYTDYFYPPCSWLIKPRYPGADRFSFRFIDGFVGADHNGSYIIDVPLSDAGGNYRLLDYADALDDSDGNQFFNVTLGDIDVPTQS